MSTSRGRWAPQGSGPNNLISVPAGPNAPHPGGTSPPGVIVEISHNLHRGDRATRTLCAPTAFVRETACTRSTCNATTYTQQQHASVRRGSGETSCRPSTLCLGPCRRSAHNIFSASATAGPTTGRCAYSPTDLSDTARSAAAGSLAVRLCVPLCASVWFCVVLWGSLVAGVGWYARVSRVLFPCLQ